MASALADSNVRPHDRFFFSDGSLYLLVENSLYCVHRYLFEIHATMFPVRELDTSRSKPYILEDVKQSDFDCLLAHLYPRNLGVEETRTTETQTTQDWISILELASRWGFNTLRSKAISRVEQTLDSPIDMVTLGRQYGIPGVLLPGYAVLCQSIVPLSYAEGLRLGMEDVVNIYRIRHELYGSGITPVPLEVAFAKVEEAGLGAERPGSQVSTWTDVGSAAASQTSAENEERGSGRSTPNVDSPPSDVASTGAITLMSAEQQHINVHSSSGEPTSSALGNRGSDVVSPDNVSDLNSGSSVSPRESFGLIEELVMSDFKLISSDVVQWVNTLDIQTLHHIMQSVVEKAIEAFKHDNPCVRLCKSMVKYTKMLHQMTRLIIQKAIEEPDQFNACARLCNMIVKDTRGNITGVGSSFCVYLGEICQENLETIAASVAAAAVGELTARVRRRRLIEFIGALADLKVMDIYAHIILNKWVTALLDPNDEEKVATLCMAMTRANHICASCNTDSCVQRVRNIVQETSKPRVRKLLQDVIKGGRVNWVVAEPGNEDCNVQ